ncbi:MAG: hypothetical protein ACFCGT_24810 [Sandaracinaceae bacterium]
MLRSAFVVVLGGWAVLTSACAGSAGSRPGGPEREGAAGAEAGTTSAASAEAGGRLHELEGEHRASLSALVPPGAVVALRADFAVARTSQGYAWMARELVREVGLVDRANEVGTWLERTEVALGVLVLGEAGGEGFLVLEGRYGPDTIAEVRAAARAYHGSGPDAEERPGGTPLLVYGPVTVRVLRPDVVAIGHGPRVRRLLAEAHLDDEPAFHRQLVEVGPRVGLAHGSLQAWASQETVVGQAMVDLVFAGETPEMVRGFVAALRAHLAL